MQALRNHVNRKASAHHAAASIAIVGLDVRSARPWPGRAFWRSVCGPPIAAPRQAWGIDLSPLVASALRAAGALVDGRTRLGVFVSGVSISSIGEPPPSLVEHVGLRSATSAVACAAAALRRGACDIAVAMAVDAPLDRADVESAALVLRRPRDDRWRPYAMLRAACESGLVGDESPACVEACAAARIDPRSLTLLDLHTTAPDTLAARLHALAPAMSRGGDALPHCTLGPLVPVAADAGVESDAACGSAMASMLGIIAAALALHHRILPPFASPRHDAISAPFCGDPAPRPWIDSSPRRAAVWDADHGSAIILEQAPGDVLAAPPPIDADWPVDLALLSAATRADLVERLRRVAALAGADAADPAVSLRDLLRQADAVGRLPARYRAAIVARDAADLARKLERLAEKVASGVDAVHMPDGIAFADSQRLNGSTALIFPGQGSQYLGMLGDLCLQVRVLQGWFERLHDVRLEGDPCPPGMLVAPPRFGLTGDHRRVLERALVAVSHGGLATLTSCLGLHAVLRSAGVRADAMAGYSNGENAALTACGAWKPSASGDIFAMFRAVLAREDEQEEVVRGLSIAVNQASPDAVREAVAAADGRVFIALENCPQQSVLFGEPAAARLVARQLKATGAICIELALDRPHHTPLYASRIPQLRSLYDTCDIRDAQVPVYSCAIAARFPSDPVAARELAVSQWDRCVRFGATVDRMYADGVRHFVEVGPGATLTGFVRSTLRGRPHLALASNVSGRPGLEQLLQLLGNLFVLGHAIDVRAVRPSDEEYPVAAEPRSTTEGARTDREEPAAHAAPATARTAPEPPASAPQAPTHVSTTVPLIFDEHTRLMREFLAAQERAHARLAEVVAGRPAFATRDALERTAVSEWPMLGDDVRVSAGRLEATRALTLATDGFLAQHVIGRLRSSHADPRGGLPVVPFTFSLELVAEAATRLAGWPRGALTLRHVRGSRWLAVEAGALTLEIVADRIDPQQVRVQIFEARARAATRAPAFEGVATHGASSPTTCRPTRQGRSRLTAADFNARLFHGPLLRAIDDVIAVDPTGVTLQAIVPPTRGLFAHVDAPALRLPAAVLDAASQFPAVWLAERGLTRFGVFPFELARYEQFGPAPSPGARLVMDGGVSVVGPVTSGSIAVLDARGALAARLEGLKTWIYEFPEPFFQYVFERTLDSRLSERVAGAASATPQRRLAPLPASLTGAGQGIWLRVLASIACSESERRIWREQPQTERLPWLSTRLIAKELVLDVLRSRGIMATAMDLDTIVHGSRVHVEGAALRVLGLVPEVAVERAGDDVVASLISTGIDAARAARA